MPPRFTLPVIGVSSVAERRAAADYRLLNGCTSGCSGNDHARCAAPNSLAGFAGLVATSAIEDFRSLIIPNTERISGVISYSSPFGPR
jgi:hypothetical protein